MKRHDLPSVSVPMALDRLLDNKHATWQSLWYDVATLLKRAQEK
jgi:hypothetical protein